MTDTVDKPKTEIVRTGQRGRPKGYPKSGGRKRGVPNKRTQELDTLVAQFEYEPLEFLLRCANNCLPKRGGEEGEFEDVPLGLRIDAAKAAATYVRSRKGVEITTADPPKLGLTINLGYEPTPKSQCA